MAWQIPVVSSATSYFNYTDWNRIEGNCVALAALLQTCGYIVALTTVTSRADGTYLDFYDSINRIEGNILALYTCYSIAPSGWITPKTTWTFDQPFSFTDTNRMEGNTLALYNLVSGIIQEYVVCGQSLAICGLTWNN